MATGPLPAADCRPAGTVLVPWSRADPRIATAAAYPETDLGLAERFALWCGDRWRHRPGHGWLRYDGTRWVLDEHGQVIDAELHQVVRAVTELEALKVGAGSDLRTAAARDRRRRWGRSCETPTRMDAALRMARALPGLCIPEDTWDADPYGVNTRSGYLHLRTGAVVPARAEHYCTGLIDAPVDPTATSPALHAVLTHLAGGDPSVVEFLSRWFGYALTGSMAAEVFTFICGAASSGKSTLLAAFTTMMGSYADTASADAFTRHRTVGGPNPELMRLAGKRFIHIPEAGGIRLDVARVKQIVGGDPVVARLLHHNPVTFRPTCKLTFTANELALVPDDDPGLRRRLLPLRVAAPVHHADPRIKHELETTVAGRAALLVFAVRGATAWLTDGANLPALRAPATVTTGAADYLAEMDPLADWWTERVTEHPDATALTSTLHADYLAFTRDHGPARPIGLKSFAQRLTRRGYPVDPDRTLGSRRTGLGLRA